MFFNAASAFDAAEPVDQSQSKERYPSNHASP